MPRQSLKFPTRPRSVWMTTAAALAIGLAASVPAGVLAVNGGACKDDYNVVIDPADFTNGAGTPNAIDNQYFPLVPGARFVYEGHKEGSSLRDVMTVTADTRTITGVTVTVVRDTAYEDGILAEDTFDWYAQDDAGNVWYFGEETTEFDEHGGVVTTFGSWEAGTDGALPGILMEASPASGDTYRQEYGLGVAVDMSTVLSVRRHTSVPHGTFWNVIETKEYSCLEKGLDHKFYAPGVGLIKELAVANGDEEIDLVSLSH
jgi:hypothetical protein